MHFHQFYLDCLAHASYLIGDAGQCVIVDPQRDVQAYVDAAAERGLRITHVLETHLHADFVSGHLELARRTGAELCISHEAGASFEHRALRDGDELRLGRVLIRVMETPGHTPESLCFLVTDEAAPDEPAKLLTGDTLFIGDVGRPDLAGGRGYTAEQMAGLMYDSLHQKILRLPDETLVYPAHGAGSSCGRNISSELFSSLGAQRETNHALQPMTREEFVERMTAGLLPPPAYFPNSVVINRAGATPLAELPELQELSPSEAAALMQQGTLCLDVRDADLHAEAHPPGAVNIGLGGNLAPWSGSILPTDSRLILLVDEPEQISQARTRLARVGLHGLLGVVSGGMPAWIESGQPVERTERIAPEELARRLEADSALQVIDVRQPGEHEGGHVPDAINLPLAQLPARLAELDASKPTAVICATGYRSSAACGLLRRAGFEQLLDVRGGTQGWIDARLPVASAAV